MKLKTFIRWWSSDLVHAIESRISAIDPNLSVKLAANYVDYMTAPISGIGTEGSGNQSYQLKYRVLHIMQGLVFSIASLM